MSLTVIRALAESPNTVPSVKRTVSAESVPVCSTSPLKIGSPIFSSTGTPLRIAVAFPETLSTFPIAAGAGTVTCATWIGGGSVWSGRSPCRSMTRGWVSLSRDGRPPTSGGGGASGGRDGRTTSPSPPDGAGAAGFSATAGAATASFPVFNTTHVLWTDGSAGAARTRPSLGTGASN